MRFSTLAGAILLLAPLGSLSVPVKQKAGGVSRSGSISRSSSVKKNASPAAPKPVVAAPKPVVAAPKPVVAAPKVAAPNPVVAPKPTSTKLPATPTSTKLPGATSTSKTQPTPTSNPSIPNPPAPGYSGAGTGGRDGKTGQLIQGPKDMSDHVDNHRKALAKQPNNAFPVPLHKNRADADADRTAQTGQLPANSKVPAGQKSNAHPPPARDEMLPSTWDVGGPAKKVKDGSTSYVDGLESSRQGPLIDKANKGAEAADPARPHAQLRENSPGRGVLTGKEAVDKARALEPSLARRPQSPLQPQNAALAAQDPPPRPGPGQPTGPGVGAPPNPLVVPGGAGSGPNLRGRKGDGSAATNTDPYNVAPPPQ